jgi:hypothetical protein
MHKNLNTEELCRRWESNLLYDNELEMNNNE